MTKKDIIKEIIRDFHRGALPESKPREIPVPVGTEKVITITGVRRSGKTFLLFEIIRRLLDEGTGIERILYINFEDERLDLQRQDLDLIVQSYRELYPALDLIECYLFFDEIQNVQGWERFIRRLHDTVSRNIFITGSNSRLLSREIATSLRGRTISIEVFPLSFKEYLQFYDVELDPHHSKTRARIINLFEQFLRSGGFPEIVFQEEDNLKWKILQEYFNVMFYRDVVERYNIPNLPALRFFIRRILENITSPLSVNKIYNELKSQGYKIGKNLLYEYLHMVESIYLFIRLNKYSESVLKQELSEKKAYIIDNGLLNALTFKYTKDFGKLLENMLFLEMYRSEREVFFYKGRRECDFLLCEGTRPTEAIQVSYTLSDPDVRRREIEGLIEVCNGFSLKRGTIVTFSDEEEFRADNILIRVMPAYRFLLE